MTFDRLSLAQRLLFTLGLLVATSNRILAYEIKEFSLPAGSHPTYSVTGPDGNMWFAEHGTDNVSKITPDGMVTRVLEGLV
jgi:streptogramin lyase